MGWREVRKKKNPPKNLAGAKIVKDFSRMGPLFHEGWFMP